MNCDKRFPRTTSHIRVRGVLRGGVRAQRRTALRTVRGPETNKLQKTTISLTLSERQCGLPDDNF